MQAGGDTLRILVVDDDPIGSRMIEFLLGEQGYTVDLVDNSRGALALIERRRPDLVLLDVNLPPFSGFDLYRKMQARGDDLPVIFVTAKGEVEDRVHGLRLGADDYICKPYQPAELTARVEAVLRRYRKSAEAEQLSAQALQAGGISIDPVSRSVRLADQRVISLTPTELKVLLQLTQRPGQIVERETMLTGVWGDNYPGESNIVDVYIRRLRRKLEADPAHPTLIQAARGVGYRFAGTAS
jgi:DNA-binding response OmpR family regulator